MNILTLPVYRPSARILQNSLQTLGIDTKVVVDPSHVDGPFIRYGNKGLKGLKDSAIDLEFNSREFIEISGNKLFIAEKFGGNGVLTPKYNKMSVFPEYFPVLIRTTLTGFKGRGMYIVETKSEFDSFTSVDEAYWTYFLDIQREYRVHVVDCEIIKLFKKISTHDDEEKYPIRNMENGYHFSIRNNLRPFERLISFVDKICSVVDIGFSAMDIGFLAKERKYILIETNSAPGLNQNSADIYARAISDRLNEI